MKCPRQARKVLFRIMRSPVLIDDLAKELDLSAGYVQYLVSDLRKNGSKILTVGSHPNYSYEYGGAHVAQQPQ